MTQEHKCKNLQIFIYRTHLCLKEIMYYDKVQSTQEFKFHYRKLANVILILIGKYDYLNLFKTFGTINEIAKANYLHFYSTCKVLAIKQGGKRKIKIQSCNYLQMFWLFAYKTQTCK